MYANGRPRKLEFTGHVLSSYSVSENNTAIGRSHQLKHEEAEEMAVI